MFFIVIVCNGKHLFVMLTQKLAIISEIHFIVLKTLVTRLTPIYRCNKLILTSQYVSGTVKGT